MTAPAPETTHLAMMARASAVKPHAGQVDKHGRDYFEHVLRPVAESLAPFGPAAVAAGWLRDSITKTLHTPQSLRFAGIPAFVVDAVVVLSRPTPTGDIRNPLARVVALAVNTFDLLDPALDTDAHQALLTARTRLLDTDAHQALLTARTRLLDRIDEDPRDIAEMVARLEAREGVAV